MIETYLVQRLEKKSINEFQAKVTQAFGGGNLQLTPDAWKLLQQYFDISYMGAAEYEFGTIPRVLKEMVDHSEELVTYTLTLDRKDVLPAPNWERERAFREKRKKELEEAKKAGVKPKRASKMVLPPFEPKTLYVICRKAHVAGTKKIIQELALNKVRTKCNNAVSSALDPQGDYDQRTIGWLELDNGFFFFLDKEAYEGTWKMFKGGDDG